MEEWIKQTLENYVIGELTTSLKPGTTWPRTYPMLYFYENGELVVTSSVVFSGKVSQIKKNPKVSLLLSNNTASGMKERHVVLVQGDATVDESDLDHGWEKYKEAWLKKEPLIKYYFDMRNALPEFWKRSVIRIKPKRIMAWKNGDMSQDPIIYEMEDDVIAN